MFHGRRQLPDSCDTTVTQFSLLIPILRTVYTDWWSELSNKVIKYDELDGF